MTTDGWRHVSTGLPMQTGVYEVWCEEEAEWGGSTTPITFLALAVYAPTVGRWVEVYHGGLVSVLRCVAWWREGPAGPETLEVGAASRRRGETG